MEAHTIDVETLSSNNTSIECSQSYPQHEVKSCVGTRQVGLYLLVAAMANSRDGLICNQAPTCTCR